MDLFGTSEQTAEILRANREATTWHVVTYEPAGVYDVVAARLARAYDDELWAQFRRRMPDTDWRYCPAARP